MLVLQNFMHFMIITLRNNNNNNDKSFNELVGKYRAKRKGFKNDDDIDEQIKCH